MGTRVDGNRVETLLWPLPVDGVTNLCFSNHSDERLLVSSWDCVSDELSSSFGLMLNFLRLLTFRMLSEVSMEAEFQCRGLVFDCCFHDEASGYSAYADGNLTRCGEIHITRQRLRDLREKKCKWLPFLWSFISFVFCDMWCYLVN
jgi:hypothetical protein